MDIEMSNAIYDGGPAYPVEYGVLHEGMTLRDRFAAQALPAIYEGCYREWVEQGYPADWRMGIALDCYSMADAMIQARREKA